MISPSKRGVCVEYEAILLFTRAGFEVFHNASPDGPIDIVVWDGENTYLIDTKKVIPYLKKDGTFSYRWDSTKTIPGIQYLGRHEDGWIWLQEPPEALLNII